MLTLDPPTCGQDLTLPIALVGVDLLAVSPPDEDAVAGLVADALRPDRAGHRRDPHDTGRQAAGQRGPWRAAATVTRQRPLPTTATR